MMNGENNGILGYGNSRRKRVKNTLYGTPDRDNGFNAFDNEERAAMNDSMEEMSAYLDNERHRWEAPLDTEKRGQDYMASARNYLVPEDNELRRRRQFVMSPRGIKEATEGFYNNNVKGIFDSERSAADARAMQAYRRAVSVPGADPVAATGAMRNENDPQRVINKTMQQLPGNELDDIASGYARYAGLSPERYRQSVLEPAIRERLAGEYVADATPKSSTEYIARSAFDNSLTGKAVNLGLEAYSPHTSHTDVSRAGLAAYDANRAERLAAGIGSLAVDMPMFAGIGSGSSAVAGKVASGITKGMSANLAKRYAARGMQLPEAERIIRRAIVGKMGAKIAQSSAVQGLTLGGYDAANSMADDLLVNDGIDVGKAVDAYAHGFATGAAVGAVGTPLKELSRGLTGGRKVAASAGVLGAESGVFTLSGNAEKLMSGVDVEPIDLLYDYGESVATLGAMRLAHWRPSGGSLKLDANGRLKQQLRLSPGEAREMSNAGVDPQRFISSLENSFKISTKKSAREYETIKNDYLKLMESDNLSAATRSKLLYLVENKITSTPPVAVDCSVQNIGADGYRATLLDANGRRISTRDFNSTKDLETFLIVNRAELRKNKIATCEEALLGKYDSENFFRQAGRYAQERGADINEIAEAMYKRANGESLDSRENSMLDDISRRTSYGDKGVGTMLHNVRRQVENEFGLHEGALVTAVNRKAYRCSAAENKALDKYLEIMQQEVETLKNGTTPARYSSLRKERENSPYGELGNEAIKAQEKERYVNLVNSADWFNSAADYASPFGGKQLIKVPENWDKPYAWSTAGLRNSYEDMSRYKQRAEEIAGKFGNRLNFLFDEREIEYNGNDAEYNRKLNAQGWMDNSNGKVYINLPNIKDMNELERTVVHEVVGHRGLSNLFGEYIFDFYEDLYKAADADVRNGIHEMGRRYSAKGYTAVEEYLAHLAEKSNPTRKERTILTRLKDYVNNLLVRMNIVSGEKSKVTTDELCNLLAAHRNAMADRQAPDSYRASVFGRFPSARHNGGYYDTPAFEKEIEQRRAANSLYSGTPSYLLPDKQRLYDDYPADVAARKNNSSYRFIGEQGAENLSNSDYGRLNEASYLVTAKEMEQQGATPQRIWEETGWARGADGKWRSELEYNTIQLNDFVYNKLLVKDPALAREYNSVLSTPFQSRTAKDNQFIADVLKQNPTLFNDLRVRDVVSDPLFYAAYPDLAHLPVKVTKSMHENAYYNPREQTLYINESVVTEPEALARTIVKPMQQMIQHYEGFEQSISAMKGDVEDALVDKYKEAVDMVTEIEGMKLNDYNKNIYSLLYTVFMDKYGCSPKQFMEYFPGVDEYIMYRMTGKPQSFAGNVEARNVLRRQSMSDVDRMMKSPQATEDYPAGRQLTMDKFAKIKGMLSGPMDVIYRNIRENTSPKPFRLNKTAERMNELRLTPMERNILRAQYDDMLARITDIYNNSKGKNGQSELEALENHKDVIESFMTGFLEEVLNGGLYRPGSHLRRYSDMFNTKHIRRDGDATAHDVEQRLRNAAKSKSSHPGQGGNTDNPNIISRSDVAAYRELIKRMEERLQRMKEEEEFLSQFNNFYDDEYLRRTKYDDDKHFSEPEIPQYVKDRNGKIIDFFIDTDNEDKNNLN